MVKAFHNEGIKVILDVVFNHSVNQSKLTQHSASAVLMIKFTIGNDQGRYITGQLRQYVHLSSVGESGWWIACAIGWAMPHWWLALFWFSLRAWSWYTDLPVSSLWHKKWAVYKILNWLPSLWYWHYGYQVGNFPSYFAEWTTDSVMISCRFWLAEKKWRTVAFAERFAGSIDFI